MPLQRTIDSHTVYKFNLEDRESLKTYVRDLLTNNQVQIQKSQLKRFSQYSKQDFRYFLSDIFSDFKAKIISLRNNNHSYPNYQQTTKNFPPYLSSNIDTKTSKFIVKQIHNINLRTREIMNNEPLSNQKFFISQNHFITFLSKVQSIVNMIEQEQSFIKQNNSKQNLFPPFNQKLSDQILEKQLEKVKLKSEQLKKIYQDLENNTNDTQIEKVNNRFKKQVNSLQDQIISCCQQIRILEIQVNELKSKLNEKDHQYEQILMQTNTQSQGSNRIKYTFSELIRTKMQQKLKIDQLEHEIAFKLNPQINQITKDLQTAESQKSYIRKIYQQILHNPPREYLQYFNGHILNYSTRHHLKWFVTNLEHNVEKRIRSTKPLYRFDRKNRENVHTYIDNIPFIVLILKLHNGQIIAAYSKPAFVPKINVELQEGYMFGLMNKKVFRLKKKQSFRYNKRNPSPIIYDEFYVIWGYSDLQIELDKGIFYSNYGNSSSAYEEVGSQDSSLQDLTQDSDNREAYLIDYELFGIQFEDE